MEIEQYNIIREAGKRISSKIFEFGFDYDNRIHKAGKLLDCVENGSFIFDTEEETDDLAEFSIYEKFGHKERLIDIYKKQNKISDDAESTYLTGMCNSHASLFEVVDVDEDNHEITVVDLLNKNESEFTFMDVNFSQSAYEGVVLYSRLLPIMDSNIASGVSFFFGPGSKAELLSALKLKKMMKRKFSVADMYILFRKKSRNLYR